MMLWCKLGGRVRALWCFVGTMYTHLWRYNICVWQTQLLGPAAKSNLDHLQMLLKASIYAIGTPRKWLICLYGNRICVTEYRCNVYEAFCFHLFWNSITGSTATRKLPYKNRACHSCSSYYTVTGISAYIS